MTQQTYYRAWGQDPSHIVRTFENENDATRYAEELAPNSCGYAFLEIVGKARELKLYSASKRLWIVDSDHTEKLSGNSHPLDSFPSSIPALSTHQRTSHTSIPSLSGNDCLLSEQTRLNAVLYDNRDVDTLARHMGCWHDGEICHQCFEAGERRWQMASIRRGLEENEKRLRNYFAKRNQTFQGETPRVHARSCLRRVREDRDSVRIFEDFCRSKNGFCEQWQYT